MSTLCLTSIISKNHDIICAQIDTDFVLLDPNKNIFCTINATGSALWNLLENNALTLEELYQYFCNNYKVSNEECLKDLTQFIKEMVKQGLLFLAD